MTATDDVGDRDAIISEYTLVLDSAVTTVNGRSRLVYCTCFRGHIKPVQISVQ